MLIAPKGLIFFIKLSTSLLVPRYWAIKDFGVLSKDELEDYGRTIGIELDRRHSKKKLINQLEEHIDYLKTV